MRPGVFMQRRDAFIAPARISRFAPQIRHRRVKFAPSRVDVLHMVSPPLSGIQTKFPPMTIAERMRKFREEHPGYDRMWKAKRRAELKALMEANKTAMHSLMLQMEQNRLATLQATSNGNYNQAAIQTLATQQAQLQTQMAVQHQALEHQIYTTVLTADQQAKFNQHRTDEINRITQHIQKMQSGATPAPAPAQ